LQKREIPLRDDKQAARKLAPQSSKVKGKETSLADLLAPRTANQNPEREHQAALLAELIPEFLKIKATDNLTMKVYQMLQGDDIISPTKRGRPNKKETSSKKESTSKKLDLKKVEFQTPTKKVEVESPAHKAKVLDSPIQSMAT